ncbi:hypothetical protein [Bacteroides sp.]|uniref:hypothetical protein n=1 Tax=Bacteroides sp. TaxID=29523 RepID=UPI002614018F|nr:hypothetical protein [Bacteroides sp.]MDD3039161.1 hypothetical protein [Bacteroides sp.]
MKYIFIIILGAVLNTVIYAQNTKVNSDSWTATDALGRKVREYKEAGDKKQDKYIAMFYWTWHQGVDDTTYSIKNISEIVRQYPEAMFSYDHPAWGKNKPGFFYWEQPLFGYYRTTDPWVLRKHAELLADAGVDVVFFDCTNGSFTWEESYEALMKTWEQARKDGVNVPKIAFMLPFGPAPHSLVSLRQLYRDIYKPHRYSDLWFIWKGKPCIMAYPDNLTADKTDREIAEFFTFRPGQPDYVNGPNRKDQWGWLEMYPQYGYVPTGDGSFEQVTVGVAQNANPLSKGQCSAFNLPNAYGRNFTVSKGFDPRVDGYLYGWNFQEQWDRAHELDPELIFVTGWNEYIAGMWLPEHGWTGEPFSFVDQYNWNCSRDIEPNKGWGDKGDVYYLQLIDNVRKFKGMNKPEKASNPKTIRLGKKGSWDDVRPYYTSYKGNTAHRDCAGRYNTYYKNTSGRNDITGAKVTHDDQSIYFYVETAGALTSCKDPNWMMLFIDTDRDKRTGWNGYDYIINRQSPTGNHIIIEKCYKNKWIWNPVGKGKFTVQDNELEISIEKNLIDLKASSIDIEFKWCDNMQDEGNIMDFYVNGDTAPGGRFNFIYTSDSQK